MTNPPRAGRRAWLGLVVLLLPALLVSMDLSVLFMALPFLSADLAPSSGQLLWILDVYGFCLAGLLLTMGVLGDRVGRRRLLLAGAVTFGLASVAAAYATSAEMLIATRALLGVAGATLAPSTLSLIRTMFPDPRQRRTAIGAWTSAFAGGAVVGPLAGGLLLEYFWWGSVFLVNVPVMLLLLVLGRVLLPESRDSRPGRFDLGGAAMSLAAVLAVIYGVKRFAEHGADGWAAVSLVAGLAVGALFVLRQRRIAEPALDVGLFRHRAFSISILTGTIAILAVAGSGLYTSQYLQLVHGMRPFTAALCNLPVVAGMLVGVTVATMLVRRVRPGTVVGLGLAVCALGFGVLALVEVESHVALLIGGAALMVAGVGMASTLATDMVIATAPPTRAGAASALSETGNELGGALGIAVLGSIGAAVYRTEITGTSPAGLPADVAAAARDTLGGAVHVADSLPGPLADALVRAAREAFVGGMQTVAVVSAVGLAVAAVLAALWLRKVRTDDAPHVAPDADEPAPVV